MTLTRLTERVENLGSRVNAVRIADLPTTDLFFLLQFPELVAVEVDLGTATFRLDESESPATGVEQYLAGADLVSMMLSHLEPLGFRQVELAEGSAGLFLPIFN